MPAPCAGLRVLDLSQGPAAGAATMILADYGAEVQKLEPPGGDRFRSLAAAPVWLRGKRHSSVDLKSEAGVARLHELARTADVVVASYRPGLAERLHADYATLAALNPRLVYCSLTAFGPRGPYSHYPGYEGLVAAKSGRMMAFEGQGARAGPVYAAVQVATHAAAQAAVQGILAALLVREQTGRGQLVETSLLQGMLPYDIAGLLTEQLMRRWPDRYPVDPLAGRTRGKPTLQYQPVLTSDGRWLQLGNLVEHLFHAFIAAADLSGIYADPRFRDVPLLADEPKEALRKLILERMSERTLAEWTALFVAEGNVASEAIVSTQAALDHPQVLHGGHVVEVDHPAHGRTRQIGLPAALQQTPGAVSPPAAVVREVDTPAWQTAAAIDVPLPPPGREPQGTVEDSRPASTGPAGANAPRHPLDGITVIECANIIAAPLACALLADLGARVIKIEPPDGDNLRNLADGVVAAKTTAGKESICLDLKSEAGRRIARQLVERADVLVHNYRPGVPERLGIGYEQVRSFNPRIVYVSATGYGSSGPYAHRPSAHPIAGASAGGVLWQAGAGMPSAGPLSAEAVEEFARRFYRANEVNPDPSASMVIATAALLGVYARQRLGVGQHVHTNMLIANLYANLDDCLDYDGKPPRPPVDADLHGLHALYRLYPAAEGWIFLACPSQTEFTRLCAAIERPELLDDSRFSSPAARRTNDAALAGILGEVLRSNTAAGWESHLTRHAVGCVQADADTPGSFWDQDAHVRDNGFVREVDSHLRWGPHRRHGPVVTLGEAPGRYGAGALAGQHSRQLLHELGYSTGEIEALFSAGTVRAETA